MLVHRSIPCTRQLRLATTPQSRNCPPIIKKIDDHVRCIERTIETRMRGRRSGRTTIDLARRRGVAASFNVKMPSTYSIFIVNLLTVNVEEIRGGYTAAGARQETVSRD